MASYSYLRRKAGLPPPTGLAQISRPSLPPKPVPAARETLTSKIKDPDFILHTARTFVACCEAKHLAGPELQSAILLMLAELKTRVERDTPSSPRPSP